MRIELENRIPDGSVYAYSEIFEIPNGEIESGERFSEIVVNENNTLISTATMLAPSSDWFVGISNFDACVNNNWLDDDKVFDLIGMDGGV